ncbi:MAG: acyl-CoA dehydrogenase family protein [Lautropia sp.]
MSLSFDFSEPQRRLRDRVRELALDKLLPAANARADAGTFPWEAVREMADLGLMGFTYPQKVGGQGGSWLDYAIILEEIGRGDLSCGWISLMQNSYPKILDDQDIIRRVCEGRSVVAFAESEPHSGGDAAAIKTTAVRRGDDYVINGFKTYVSLVPGADVLLVTAMTDLAAVRRGMSMFVMPADTPGVTITAIPEPGVKAHMLGSITLEDVRVPRSALVGEENRGFYMMKSRWDYTRGAAGPTMMIGAALQSLDETVQRAKEKRTFGKPLLKWPSLQFKLTDHYTRLEAARWLAYEGAWRADQGERVTAHASMLKTLLNELCTAVHRDCLEIWGGAAYRSDHPIYRRMTDNIGWQLAGGGIDIHRIILGVERFGRAYAAHKDDPAGTQGEA